VTLSETCLFCKTDIGTKSGLVCSGLCSEKQWRWHTVTGKHLLEYANATVLDSTKI